MNRKELQTKLIDLGIPKSFYSLDDNIILEGTSIVCKDSQWEVFQTDRGRILTKKKFSTETEACEFVFKLFTSFPYNKIDFKKFRK